MRYLAAMLPDAIILQNYRSFVEPVELELRPVTMLFGINNSGKSALLRALPLIADSVAPDVRGALDMNSHTIQRATFSQLRWHRPGPDDEQDLIVGVRWGDSTARYFITQDFKRIVVRRLQLDGDEWVWFPRREEARSPALTYTSSAGETQIEFRGLVPHQSKIPALESLHERLVEGMRGTVLWLRAVRAKPERTLTVANLQTWQMVEDGADVAEVLAGNPDILAEVSAWYEANIARRLSIEPVSTSDPNKVRLALRPTGAAALDIDLLDSGEGIIQVLPVLTALSMASRWKEGGPRVLVIEEPESHLNPRLQRALAERIAAVAAQPDPPRLFLETHSLHLLAAIQLLVVDPDSLLKTDSVRIYWVHQDETGRSLAEAITLDEQARFQGPWPHDVFTDLQQMARDLLNARRARHEG
ncbi:MAG: putative ATPase [Myxococcota bacterium]|jgi:predicted ATPase